MTFPANDSGANSAARDLLAHAKALRQAAVNAIAECDTGTVNIREIYERMMARRLAPIKTQWAQLIAEPGVYDALVRLKPGTFTNAADAQTKALEAQTAIDTLISTLETEAPRNVANYLLVLSMALDGSGRITDRTTSNAGSIATLRAALVLFRDTFTP